MHDVVKDGQSDDKYCIFTNEEAAGHAEVFFLQQWSPYRLRSQFVMYNRFGVFLSRLSGVSLFL